MAIVFLISLNTQSTQLQIRHFILPAFLLLFCCWTSCKKEEAKPKPPEPIEQIFPGQGFAGLKVGDPAQKALDKYGSITSYHNIYNGLYQHYLQYKNLGIFVYCQETGDNTFNAQMKIKGFSLSAPFKGQTDKKIGVGSKKSDVKAAYGEPTTSIANYRDTYAIGLKFYYDDAGETAEYLEIE